MSVAGQEIVVFDPDHGAKRRLVVRYRDRPHDAAAAEDFGSLHSISLDRERQAEFDVGLNGQRIADSKQDTRARNILGLPFKPSGISKAPEANGHMEWVSWCPHWNGS
jgi:hypothetical protein